MGAGSGKTALFLIMDGGLAGCGSMSLAQLVLVNRDQIQTDTKMAETTPKNCGMCQCAKLKRDMETHSLELSPPVTSISLARADATEGGMFNVCSAVLDRHACTP